MVAHSRHIEILSKLGTPFVNGEPDGRNMDIRPDTCGWSSGRLSGSSAVLPEHLYARQERKAADHGGALREGDINQQTWPIDQTRWTGDGRASRSRWVSGGI